MEFMAALFLISVVPAATTQEQAGMQSSGLAAWLPGF